MRFHRVLLVVNPVARTVSKPTLAVIEKALSADFALEVAETKERGHASELASQAVADGIDLVLVFSGDGTINEAVNALAGSECALGVLPGGATNVLVRALGLPTDPVECTGVLIGKALDDEAFKLHLGRADGRYFAVNCGAGIDAAAMHRLDRKFPKTKSRFDRAAFRAVAWELMVGYAGKRADLRVTIDGGDPLESLSVMVGRTDPNTY
jgi:diacylglycerol kinase family enzyme